MEQQSELDFIVQPEDPFVDFFRIDLSYTRLRTFMECRRKYKLLYVEKIETEKTPALVLGGAAHHALEQYAKEGSTSPEELVGFFIERVEREIPLLDEEAIANGVVMLNDWWNDQQEVTPARLYDVEVYFEIPMGCARMRGYIDRLEVEPGEGKTIVKVIDYKSGKSQLSEKGMKKDLQLPIYALAARHMYPGPEYEIQCGMYYLRTGLLRMVTFTDKELARYRKRVEDWANKIVNEEDFKPCWSDYTCRMCPLNGDYCDWPERRPRRGSG